MLRPSLLCVVLLFSTLCLGAEPSLTGFYIVSPEASVGSHFFDSQPYPKLGYIADRPDLLISRLESVAALERCGMIVSYRDPNDETSGLKSETPQCVTFQLRPMEAQVFESLTTCNVGRTMLLLIDGEPICAPVIRMPISGGSVRISLSEKADAADIKRKLDSLVTKP